MEDRTRKTAGILIVLSIYLNAAGCSGSGSEKTTLGNKDAKLFSAESLPWNVTILKAGEYQTRDRSQTLLPNESVKIRADWLPEMAHLTETATGSNNWVISPARSKSGRAWFANDPHLALKHPPFWHWSHIQGGNINAIGASFAGVPMIVSGTNRHVAWGLTNSYLDVGDVFYISESELKQVPVKRPLIWVRFWKFRLPFLFKTYRRTPQNWPVLPLPAPEGKAMVLRWTGLDLNPNDFNGFHKIMESRSVQEADQAFAQMGVPSWNFVFADIHGGIGFRSVGKTPRRSKEPYFGVPERSLKKASEWTFLNSSQMPHVLNPARGFIATANNSQWSDDAKWNLGRAHTHSFRAFRIEELLKQVDRHDLKSLKNIQCDTQAVDARFFLPELLKFLRKKTSG